MSKSTEMLAKKDTICPLCMEWVRKGTKIKVYANKWLHKHCYEKFITAKRQRDCLKETYF